MALRRYVAVRDKIEAVNIGISETGHLNISCSQTSYRDMPYWKSKLESEFWLNPLDLRSQIYIYRCATRYGTLQAIAYVETVDFKMKKVFTNLSLGLPYYRYSMASSQLQSRDTVPLTPIFKCLRWILLYT
jgi:hypothetical protein